jgi:hypothetical protein
MVLELILFLAVGIFILSCGILIWKKEKITLIHSYHYIKVKDENKKAYTTILGKGICLIGSGCVLAGAINFATKSGYGWILFTVCFLAGLILVVKAQTKYNR